MPVFGPAQKQKWVQLIQSTDGTKLGGVDNVTEDRTKIQGDLNGLETWAQTHKMNFDRDKCKVLYLGRENQMHKYKIFLGGGDTWLTSST